MSEQPTSPRTGRSATTRRGFARRARSRRAVGVRGSGAAADARAEPEPTPPAPSRSSRRAPRRSRSTRTTPAATPSEVEEPSAAERARAPLAEEPDEPEPERRRAGAAAEEPDRSAEAAAGACRGRARRSPTATRCSRARPTARRRTVAIVVSRFNGEITNRLLESRAGRARGGRRGARRGDSSMPVPGAFELPLAAMALAKTRRYSCVVALGCVIRGETPHFDYVAGEAASGLQLAGIETGVPVSFGVLTVRHRRAGGGAASTRAPGPRAPRSRWPTCSRSCARPLRPRAATAADVRSGVRYTAAAMSKVCSICGKKPSFGNNRSHSMVATKRRFDPNLQRVRILSAARPRARTSARAASRAARSRRPRRPAQPAAPAPV